MIERSTDVDKLQWAFDMLPPEMMKGDSAEKWLAKPANVMLVEGDNVGLATYEYPGVYTVHWFFTARGREAIKLARRMFKVMFDEYGAETLRGLTRVDLKAARWLAKQAGLTSYGFVTFKDGDEYEILFITKDEFNRQELNG